MITCRIPRLSARTEGVAESRTVASLVAGGYDPADQPGQAARGRERAAIRAVPCPQMVRCGRPPLTGRPGPRGTGLAFGRSDA